MQTLGGAIRRFRPRRACTYTQRPVEAIRNPGLRCDKRLFQSFADCTLRLAVFSASRGGAAGVQSQTLNTFMFIRSGPLPSLSP